MQYFARIPVLVLTHPDYLPTDWSEAQGLLDNPTTLTGTTSDWVTDGFANNGTTGAARINIYSTNKDEWLFTPYLDLGDGSIPNVLEFDLALTDYGNSDPPEGVGDDDKFAVVISTDNGETWSSVNALQIWDNTTTPSYSDISTTGERISIDLAGYTKTVKELMVLFHFASLLVTNDGGPGHFASITPISSIILYGPETPAIYGSLGEKSVSLYHPLSCSPCLTAYNHRNSPCDGDNLCLKSILPEEVIFSL